MSCVDSMANIDGKRTKNVNRKGVQQPRCDDVIIDDGLIFVT